MLLKRSGLSSVFARLTGGFWYRRRLINRRRPGGWVRLTAFGRLRMRKHLLALVITACAFALTFVTRGAFQQNVFSFFTCAVAITAYLCGTTPALLATALAIACSAIELMEPIGSFRVSAASDVARLIAFTVTSVLIIGIVHRLRSTQNHLESTLADLEYIKTSRRVWNWGYDVASDRVTWSNYMEGMEVRQERNLGGWLDLVHTDDRKRVEEQLRSALKSGNLELTYRFRMSGTTTVKLLTHAKMVRRNTSDSGRLVGVSMEPIAPRSDERLTVTRA